MKSKKLVYRLNEALDQMLGSDEPSISTYPSFESIDLETKNIIKQDLIRLIRARHGISNAASSAKELGNLDEYNAIKEDVLYSNEEVNDIITGYEINSEQLSKIFDELIDEQIAGTAIDSGGDEFVSKKTMLNKKVAPQKSYTDGITGINEARIARNPDGKYAGIQMELNDYKKGGVVKDVVKNKLDQVYYPGKPTEDDYKNAISSSTIINSTFSKCSDKIDEIVEKNGLDRNTLTDLFYELFTTNGDKSTSTDVLKTIDKRLDLAQSRLAKLEPKVSSAYSPEQALKDCNRIKNYIWNYNLLKEKLIDNQELVQELFDAFKAFHIAYFDRMYTSANNRDTFDKYSAAVRKAGREFNELPTDEPIDELSHDELLDADTQAMADYQKNKKPYHQLSFSDLLDELDEAYMTEGINWDRMLITKCAKGAAWAKGMKLCNYNDIYEVVEFTDYGNVYVDMCKKDTDDPYVADACPEFTEEEFADYLRVYNKMFGDEDDDLLEGIFGKKEDKDKEANTKKETLDDWIKKYNVAIFNKLKDVKMTRDRANLIKTEVTNPNKKHTQTEQERALREIKDLIKDMERDLKYAIEAFQKIKAAAKDKYNTPKEIVQLFNELTTNDRWKEYRGAIHESIFNKNKKADKNKDLDDLFKSVDLDDDKPGISQDELKDKEKKVDAELAQNKSKLNQFAKISKQSDDSKPTKLADMNFDDEKQIDFSNIQF